MGVVVLVKTLCHFDWQGCKDAKMQAARHCRSIDEIRDPFSDKKGR